MTELSGLTPRQIDVLDSTERVTLVLGGAGCGKTTVALWAARVELFRPETRPWQRMAFLTFSRSAVDQIGGRSRAALRGLGDRVEIATFHAFAYRLVRSFGRYSGMGQRIPELQSAASAKLLGAQPDRLRYDDLLPSALEVLQSPGVCALVADRWPLIVCDEFQDTSVDQWRLLELLGKRSRLLLLADPHQMIYTFVPGVTAERLETARHLADLVVELEPASHRDPTGAIPALADAVRRRDFCHEAVHAAVQSGRLRVVLDVHDEQLVKVIGAELNRAWRGGSRSFGIFGHSNEGVAWLGNRLTGAGVDYVLVGIPEAQAEALSAMTTLLSLAVGKGTGDDVPVAFATFLTACSRSRQPPALATALAGASTLPPALVNRLTAIKDDVVTEGLDALPDTVATAWERLGITAGERAWARAVPAFAAAVRRASRLGLNGDRLLAQVRAETDALRIGALLESSGARLPSTQLMNFHQTKGREADAVILVYRDGDYLADRREGEPYPVASRILYVSLTRARKEVVVLLPAQPHPLVQPFATLAPILDLVPSPDREYKD